MIVHASEVTKIELEQLLTFFSLAIAAADFINSGV